MSLVLPAGTRTRPSALDLRPSAPILTLDPLAEAEKNAGLVPRIEPLPLPPSQKTATAGPSTSTSKRPFDHSLTEGTLARGKRPKAVKFSPSKGKRPARVVAGGSATATSTPAPVLNNDFCDSCTGKGHFLCCEGCPRSFHFSCLDPPLELDEIPQESWFCKVCADVYNPSQNPTPARGLFGQLISKASKTNPSQFALPSHIRATFPDLNVTEAGEYYDESTAKTVKLNKHGFFEQLDRYKVKDKNGRYLSCYQCSLPGSAITRKQIISCDYCDNHWHLDCLEPPLSIPPPKSRKWMCPIHADHDAPIHRRQNPQHAVSVKERNIPNNGNITIKPRPALTQAEPQWDEVIQNGLRYQVPEETLILDFWGKVRNEPKAPNLTYKEQLAKQLGIGSSKTPTTAAVEDTGHLSDSSLSSLSSLDGSPAPDAKPEGKKPSTSLRVVPREIIHTSQHTALPTADRIPSPTPHFEVAIDSRKKHRPSPTPESESASSKRAARRAARSIQSAQNGRNAHTGGPPGSTTYSPLKLRLTLPAKSKAKGKERAVEPWEAVSSASMLQVPVTAPLPSSKSAVALPSETYMGYSPSSSNNGPVTSTSIPSVFQPPVHQPQPPQPRGSPRSSLSGQGSSSISPLKQTVSPKLTSSANQPVQDASMSPSSIAPNNGSTLSAQPASPPSTLSPFAPNPSSRPLAISRSNSRGSDASASDSSLAIQSKEDLQALSHVRKLLRGNGYSGQKGSVVDFIMGEAPIVPVLDYLEHAKAGAWQVPWDQASDESNKRPQPAPVFTTNGHVSPPPALSDLLPIPPFSGHGQPVDAGASGSDMELSDS